MKNFFFLWIFAFFRLSLASDLGHLSFEEIQDVDNRLKDFFSRPMSPESMNRQGIKFSPQLRKIIELHPELKTDRNDFSSSLDWQAQHKISSSYQDWFCEKVLKKISHRFPCRGEKVWSDFQKEDRVSDLTHSWVEEVLYAMDDLPLSGSSESPLWSDDYWAMARGLISYRYSNADWFTDYWEAVQSYFQPQEWLSLKTLSLEKKEKIILEWSPSEKYDLSVKDESFSLTQEQKKEGEWYQNEEGEVEGWMGLCHGWAPASIMVPRPEKSVDWIGPDGVRVQWYPNDIKALITLAWANGNWESNFVGRRCEQKKLELFSNGRIKSNSCFDNNPATFHLALANLVGKAKSSFVMDKAYDYQVWNQPVVSYKLTFFNPLNSDKKSKNWKKVAVRYDEKFKKQDRFQKPLTRGKFREGNINGLRWATSRAQDAHIDKVVGVIASVEYLVESVPAEFGPEPGRDSTAREVYLYDLELVQQGHTWVVTGGEWYQNNHPDFLFVPQRGTFPTEFWDSLAIQVDPRGTTTDGQSLEWITGASQKGYPLRSVLNQLIEASTLPQSRSK